MNVASYILLALVAIWAIFAGMAYSAPRLLRLRREKILLQIM